MLFLRRKKKKFPKKEPFSSNDIKTKLNVRCRSESRGTFFRRIFIIAEKQIPEKLPVCYNVKDFKADMFLTPIVRNGKQSTIGYKPEIWKEWK